MKIFFIIPPRIHYIEPYAYAVADKSNEARVSLGLLYIAAQLKKKLGIDIQIIDSSLEELTLDDLEIIIKEQKPDIVGFSVLTFNLLNCIEVSKIIKKCSPTTKICYGGWHPTLYPEETLKLDWVDYIVIGEGEITFTELISNKKPDKINGIGYKTNNKIIINPPRDIIRNLDEIPFPAYNLIDINRYSNLLASSNVVMTIMTSRGCPHQCIFCDLRKTPFRFRSPANIMQEITYWEKKGIKEFFIQDDNFTISRKRAIELCKMLIDSDLKIKYKISSRVDSIDDELMNYLKKSGCYRIYFGVESGSQKILDYLQKGIKIEQIKNAFSLSKKYRIDACAYIMIGVPTEEKEDIDKTIKLINEIKPDHLHCSICTPMPKTFLYQKLMQEGFIHDDYWQKFAHNPNISFKTPFSSSIYSDKELRDMQNSIQKKFYFNIKIIIHEVVKTRNLKKLFSKAKVAYKMIRE